MYIMFPIGFMYYFGINLHSRFNVPDFWPKEGQTHQIPFERDEIAEELKILKERRLAARAQRLAKEAQGESTEVAVNQEAEKQTPRPDIVEATTVKTGEGPSSPWNALFETWRG